MEDACLHSECMVAALSDLGTPGSFTSSKCCAPGVDPHDLQVAPLFSPSAVTGYKLFSLILSGKQNMRDFSHLFGVSGLLA